MVQALAYAELLIGGLLSLAGYKGVSISELVQGTAPEGAKGLSTEEDLPELASASPGSIFTESAEAIGNGTALTSTPGFHASAPAPAAAGADTWKSLRKEVKEGKLKQPEVQERIKKLEGK